jgi:hypothetical protein
MRMNGGSSFMDIRLDRCWGKRIYNKIKCSPNGGCFFIMISIITVLREVIKIIVGRQIPPAQIVTSGGKHLYPCLKNLIYKTKKLLFAG